MPTEIYNPEKANSYSKLYKINLNIAKADASGTLRLLEAIKVLGRTKN